MLKIIKLIIICTELSKNINGGYIEISKTVTPTLLTQKNYVYTAYLCKFDVHVECFWRKNNKTTSFKPLFAYLKENGKNTTDCTIIAPHLAAASEKFKSENPKLECHGYVQTESELRHVTLGSSAKLECGLQKASRCSWERSGKSVVISDRYRYVNALAKTEKVTNCSIIIFNINAIDEGVWQCSRPIIVSTTNTIKIATSYKLAFGDSNMKKTQDQTEQMESLKSLTEAQVSTKNLPITTTTMTRTIATNEMTIENTTKMFVGNIAEVVSSEKFHEMELKIVILLSALGFVFFAIITGLTIYVVKKRRNNLRNLKKRSKTMSTCDRIVNDLYSVQDNRISSRYNTRQQLYSDSNSETYLVPIKLNADSERRLYDVDHIYEEISEFVINKTQTQTSNENNELEKNSSTIQSKPLPIPINYNLDAQQ